MFATEICVEDGQALSSKKLRCPMCGAAAVTFNSRTTVALRGVVEWLAIFACPESHVFFIPMTLATSRDVNLDQVRSRSLLEMQMIVRELIERTRATVLTATASVDASRHLLRRVRRTRNKWLSQRTEGQVKFSTLAPETIH